MTTLYPRQFVPAQFDPSRWDDAEPLFRGLLDRPLDSPEGLERWLADVSELTAVISEYGNRRYIDKSCHTDDKQIEARYLHYVEQIEPKIRPLGFQLERRFLDSAHSAALQQKDVRYAMLARRWRAETEIFREENVPIQTEVTKLVTEYDTICGDMTVSFRGEELTLQQAGKFLEEPDRTTRQEVWELIANRRYRDRDKIEGLFDQMLERRGHLARNAGLPDFRAYMWKEYKRFDYTPEQCVAFADAIARTVVPLVDEMDRRRTDDLGLPALRPWDTQVDPRNRPALAPFGGDDTPALVDKSRQIFERLSPALAEDFDSLSRRNNLDLASRKGKQPGGYQCDLEEAREPFIFMNAAGMQRDVETLLHEGGHAFHSLAAREEPLTFLRSAPIEFCEVASMSMELLGADHFDVFYANPADAARAKRTKLEDVIKVLPWIATIDSFQHWLYTHPGHSRAERKDFWLELLDRFDSKLNWAGYERVREMMWQEQMHLFSSPFYYVEYGIAQLGALQLWVNARRDGARALAAYRAALKLGGTRPLPELFATAGITFDFSENTLGPLMNAVNDELARLPR